MTANSLKKKLINTKYFIDNSYLNMYIDLIMSSKIKKIAFKTQTHHIIPKCYYRHFKIDIDNSSSNLVELLFKDHVLAHWLLQRCTIGFLRRNNGYATRMLINTKNFLKDEHTEEELTQIQALYESSMINISKKEFVDFYTCHTRQETINHFGINKNIVSQLAKQYNCSKWSARRIDFFKNGSPIITKEELEKYYLIENHTLLETAEYFNVNKVTIIRDLKKFNLSQRKAKYRHLYKLEYRTSLSDKEIIEFINYYKNHSMKNTSLYFNMSYDRVKFYVKKLNISKRKRRE